MDPALVAGAGMIDMDTVVAIGVVTAMLVAAWLLGGRSAPGRPWAEQPTAASSRVAAGPATVVSDHAEEAAVRRTFANVFSMLTPVRREDLLQNRMRSKGCSRIEAMRGLLKDRGVDEIKYDS